MCGVRSREVESWLPSRKVQASVPESGYQIWDCSLRLFIRTVHCDYSLRLFIGTVHCLTHLARVFESFPGSKIEKDFFEN